MPPPVRVAGVANRAPPPPPLHFRPPPVDLGEHPSAPSVQRAVTGPEPFRSRAAADDGRVLFDPVVGSLAFCDGPGRTSPKAQEASQQQHSPSLFPLVSARMCTSPSASSSAVVGSQSVTASLSTAGLSPSASAHILKWPATMAPSLSTGSTAFGSLESTSSAESGGPRLSKENRTVSDLEERLLKAELLIKERDQQIEALQGQLSKFTAQDKVAGSLASFTTMDSSANRDIDFDMCRISYGADGSCLVDFPCDANLEAQVDDAVRKSEALLNKISSLGTVEEPEMQWRALMAANEDCKDRLEQIEALVQRRVEQLPPGEAELRVCRAVRGLCVGAQRYIPRRWALGGGSPGATNRRLSASPAAAV